MLENEDRSQINEMIDDYASKAMFGVAKVPAHAHTGVDSQQIDYNNLVNKPTRDTSSYVTLTDTQTLTNKRYTKRVDAQASTNTITPEISAYDVFVRTAQAHDLVINNHSTSTPNDGDMMLFEILSDATPRAISFGNKYVAKAGVPLPTTTVASKNISFLVIWRADLSQWNLLWAGQE